MGHEHLGTDRTACAAALPGPSPSVWGSCPNDASIHCSGGVLLVGGEGGSTPYRTGMDTPRAPLRMGMQRQFGFGRCARATGITRRAGTGKLRGADTPSHGCACPSPPLPGRPARDRKCGRARLRAGAGHGRTCPSDGRRLRRLRRSDRYRITRCYSTGAGRQCIWGFAEIQVHRRSVVAVRSGSLGAQHNWPISRYQTAFNAQSRSLAGLRMSARAVRTTVCGIPIASDNRHDAQ